MGQMSLLGASVALLLLINTIGATVITCQGLPLNSDRYSKSSEARADGEIYRLPPTVTPENYTITLTPDYEEYATFIGEVEILVTGKTGGNNISLHYDNMTIDSRTVTDIDGTELQLVGDDYYDNITNIYTLTLSSGTFAQGKQYKINIKYSGYLLDDMAGFYRSSYTTANGEKRWLVTTQFEPTDARRAFPCFDEPALKAGFQINIRRPKNLGSISNAALNYTTNPSPDDGLVMDVFELTPPMSTYLVAFIVSDFANVTDEDDNHLYRIWAREDSVTQAEYGLSVTPKIIQFMEQFTTIPFEFKKLDQAAIPDFSAGAMENWALVTYRERLILFKNGTSTTSNKQSIATVIAHELSHQWFGDLVTPDWWDYLWLNEGFATYFEYFTTHAVERDWLLDQQFVLDAHQYALAADASNATRPITTRVFSPAQINSIFDTIAYEKAGSIIRQAEHFLTTDVFVNGLRTYLNNRKYDSATPDDLFAALQESADAAGTYQDPDLNVKSIMESWTIQAGYPLITASGTSDGSINITQERFLLNGASEPDPKTTWLVPITYTKMSNMDFNITVPEVWLNQTQGLVTANLTTDEWFILNIQETAFYRVLYNEENYKLLTDYLNSDKHTNIHPLNKAQLLDDSLNLARAGVLNYSIALDITTYLERETDYIPWTSYFRALTFLNIRLNGTEVYDSFKAYVLTLLANVYDTLGFEEKEADTHVTLLNRVNVLTWACRLGQEDCVKNATDIFRGYEETEGNNTIPANLRSIVFCTALEYGDEKEWNFLWDRYKESTISTEQVTILSALGCTKNVSLLTQYLEKSIDENSGIRMQDAASVFSAVYSNPDGVETAFNFLKSNFQEISDFYGSMNAVSNIINGIAGRLTTDNQVSDLENFINENNGTLGSATEAGRNAVEVARANLEWTKNHKNEILDWLQNWSGESNGTDGSGSTGTDGIQSTQTNGSGNIATNTIVITVAFIIALLHTT